MAGDAIVDKWILEYVCYKAWNEFERDKGLSSRTVDYISAVISEDCNQTDSTRILFLVVLCRINDGEKVFVEYFDNQETTVLEDLIPMFEKLVTNQTSDLVIEGLDIIDHLIKSEAVLVCIRQGDYKRASEVFHGLWAKVNSKNKKDLVKLKMLLKEITDKRSASQVQMKSFTYANFLDSLIKYLSKVHQKFNTPLLVKAGESKHARDEQIEEGSTRKSYANKRLKKDDIVADKEIAEESKNSNPKRKLRQLWNNNVDELFGSKTPRASTSVNDSQDNSGDQDQDKHDTNENSKKSDTQTASTTFATPRSSPFKSPASLSPLKRPHQSPLKSKSPLPKPVYRRNEGRPNRHDPAEADNGHDQDDDSFDRKSVSNLSMMSITSRRKWTDSEAEEFYDAVVIYGVGQWAKIKEHLGTSRTNVMLKDKWRTMVKRGEVDMFNATRGKKRKT